MTAVIDDLQRDLKSSLPLYLKEWPEEVIDLLIDHEYIPWVPDDEYEELVKLLREGRVIIKWGR